MSSHRSARKLVVAVLLGVLVGGGLLAVTPAGAEISTAAVTNWKKIWRKNLQPQADKRYYPKADADAKYATKADADAKYATKAEADAKYATKAGSTAAATAAKAASDAATDAKLAGYYAKSESDARYAPRPAVVRGVWALSGANAGFTQIVYPELSAPPTVKVIPEGALVPEGCSGTPVEPDAWPGFLCIFEVKRNAMSGITVTRPSFGGSPSATAFGTTVWASASGPSAYVTGTYAVRPAG